MSINVHISVIGNFSEDIHARNIYIIIYKTFRGLLSMRLLDSLVNVAPFYIKAAYQENAAVSGWGFGETFWPTHRNQLSMLSICHQHGCLIDTLRIFSFMPSGCICHIEYLQLANGRFSSDGSHDCNVKDYFQDAFTNIITPTNSKNNELQKLLNIKPLNILPQYDYKCFSLELRDHMTISDDMEIVANIVPLNRSLVFYCSYIG